MSCVSLPDRGLTYKDSGVDIAAGNRLVDMIKPLAKATARAGNLITLTHFLSLLRPRLKPCRVSA
jgi:phosphoribosylaminoimidazole (AIR) synthetase